MEKVYIKPLDDKYSAMSEFIKDKFERDYDVRVTISYSTRPGSKSIDENSADSIIYIVTPDSFNAGEAMFNMAIQATGNPEKISILFYDDEEVYSNKAEEVNALKSNMKSLGCSVYTKIADLSKSFQLNILAKEDIESRLMNASEAISNFLENRLFKEYGSEIDKNSLEVSRKKIEELLKIAKNTVLTGEEKSNAENILENAETLYAQGQAIVESIRDTEHGFSVDIDRSQAKELPEGAVIILGHDGLFSSTRGESPAIESFDRKSKGMLNYRKYHSQEKKRQLDTYVTRKINLPMK